MPMLRYAHFNSSLHTKKIRFWDKTEHITALTLPNIGTNFIEIIQLLQYKVTTVYALKMHWETWANFISGFNSDSLSSSCVTVKELFINLKLIQLIDTC